MTLANRANALRSSRRTRRSTAHALAVALACVVAGCGTTNAGSRERFQDPAVSRSQAVALADQAQRASKAGDDERAEVLYLQAVNADPGLFSAWNNLGDLLLRRGDNARAAQAFRQAAELEPTAPRPMYNVGLTYQRLGWAQEALDAFREALSRDPSHVHSLRGATRAAEMLRLSDETALEHVRNAQLHETDPAWRTYFERQRFRIEDGLRTQKEEG